MQSFDTLVLNEDHDTTVHSKRRNDPLECYNCGELYYPDQGQGFVSPRHLNAAGKEFCDVACQLSFAKSTMDEFDFPDYYEAMCAHLGHRPDVPPLFTKLERFGGDLTLEQYKGIQINHELSKRICLTEDEVVDMQE